MTPLLRAAFLVFLPILATATLAPLPACADIFAAVNVAAPPPRTDLDVAVVNASLGTRVALPANVNTTAFEIHPSISGDGRRLVFFRFGGSDGQRLLLVDTSTGQSADLFTPTEIAGNPIFNSNINANGTTVATGRRFRQITFSGGSIGFSPQVTFTNVGSFPTGPFSRVTTRIGPSFATTGSVTDVAFGGNGILLFRLLNATGLGQLLVFQAGRTALLSSSTGDLGHPAMRADDSSFVVSAFFEHRAVSPLTGAFGNSNLGSSVADPALFGGTTPSIFTPGPINTGADESQPAVTRDGRYFAFVRHGSDGRDRLFVRDLATQTFLNANGVDLGLVATRGIGSVSLYLRSVLTSSVISRTGNVNATLTAASNIGILVQRIVGKTKVDGRKQYELETVGRVPLGSFGAGNVFTHWDFEVEGEPLAPGKYLVTLRALEGDVVRELGRPQVLQIKKNGRVVTRGEYEW